MDELAGVIQNVNLGWFLIEQAEEFDTDNEFTKLRGRLRRGDFQQGIIIANTNGHNWIWRGWKQTEDEDYPLVEANTFDNKINLPDGFIADLRKMQDQSPAQYRRYVLNSWEETDTADACIPYEHILRAVNAEIFCLHDKRRLIACDPAEFGNDKTIIMAMEEGKVIDIEALRKKEPMETAGRIVKMMRKYNAKLVAIDSIGIGAGIRSRIGELGHDVLGVNVGVKSDDPENFRNLKAQIWMHAQDMFRENLISLPDHDELIEDLAAVKYLVTSKGQVSIEKKDDTKKRLGRSPDMGDAFVLGLWGLRGMGKDTHIDYEEEDSEVADSYSIKSVL